MEAIENKFSDSLVLDTLGDADITLQSQGGTVKAHRSVLATASPFFREMFLQREMTALQALSLLDMTVESLQLLLDLLYMMDAKKGPMPEFDAAIDEHFNALFDATHKFKVEARLNVVLKLGLQRHLTPANCWDFYHKCKDLALLSEHDFSEVCLWYVLTNCEEVIKSESTLVEMRRDPQLVLWCVLEAKAGGFCEL